MNIETKLCECGCGEKIVPKPHHKYTGTPKFIHGHASRMPDHYIPTHNIKHSEESKKRMSDAKKLLVGELSPRFGAKLSDETKEKISKAKIGKPSWNKGVFGVIKVSKKTKEKMSNAHKGKKNSMFGRCGELCPSWKGGTSLLRDLVQESFQYQQWRKDVFSRDNYTCRKCGGKGDEYRRGYYGIHAHHITPFAKIICEHYEELKKGMYDIPILTDINNGITLCMRCHMDFHAGRADLNVI